MRPEFSKATKIETFQRAGGKCENCGISLTPASGVEYDHIVPCAIGGGNGAGNCQALCRNCHASKSHGSGPGSNSGIAKGKRAAAKHINASERRGAGIPGSRSTRFKKKINGTVELR